jgi:hypothetical protein
MKDRCHYWFISTSLPHFLHLGNAFNAQATARASTTLSHDVTLSASVPMMPMTTADYVF